MNQHYNEPRMSFQLERITWAVQKFIFANCIVFAAMLLLSIPFGGIVKAYLVFNLDMVLAGQVWRPFTYMFLHAGLLHLFMNMLWLFFFGPDVERSMGTRQFVRFYFFCGALGVMATLLLRVLNHTSASNAILGASGAVMGVLFAFAMINPDRKLYIFPLPVPINARTFVIIIIIYNVIMSVGNSNISVETHLGGMAAAWIYLEYRKRFSALKIAKPFRKSKKKKSPPDEDSIQEAVDNIFNFNDKNKHDH